MKYTITVKSAHSKASVEVTAYKTGTPGLITHHNVYPNAFPSSQIGALWVVTHERSGQSLVGRFNLRKDAKEFAKRIKDMIDWTQDAEYIKAHVNTRDIQRVYRGEVKVA